MRRLVLALLLFSSPAYAGRTLYGWLLETDTVPAGGLEIETSIFEQDNLGPYHERSTSLLWTPAIGLTDCLELAVPVELVTRTQDDAAPWSGIGRYGAELRYRFLRGVPGLRPLARFALSRNVAIQSQLRTEVELAASYDYDRFEVEADLGGVLDLNFGHPHQELRPGIGASVLVNDELRLGAELYAQHSRDATTASWAVLGPDVAWVRGRFWLSGVLGVGIAHITAAPRLNIGMAW
jgi:hypothetical protein